MPHCVPVGEFVLQQFTFLCVLPLKNVDPEIFSTEMVDILHILKQISCK